MNRLLALCIVTVAAFFSVASPATTCPTTLERCRNDRVVKDSLTALSVPAYYLAYNGGSADAVDDLRKEVEGLRKDIAELKALLTGKQPLKAVPVKAHERIMVAGCMTCHSSTSAKPHGKLTMDADGGRLRAFTAAETLEIQRRVISSDPKVKMPPPTAPKLSGEQMSAVITGLIEAKPADAPPKP